MSAFTNIGAILINVLKAKGWMAFIYLLLLWLKVLQSLFMSSLLVFFIFVIIAVPIFYKKSFSEYHLIIRSGQSVTWLAISQNLWSRDQGENVVMSWRVAATWSPRLQRHLGLIWDNFTTDKYWQIWSTCHFVMHGVDLVLQGLMASAGSKIPNHTHLIPQPTGTKGSRKILEPDITLTEIFRPNFNIGAFQLHIKFFIHLVLKCNVF